MKGNSILFSDYSHIESLLDSRTCYEYNSITSLYVSSLYGNSQPYKKQYSVYAKMMKKDIKYGVYDTVVGYKKNPTAQNLGKMINGNYIVSKHFNKKVPYVITVDGEVIIGSRNGNGKTPSKLPTPHPTLIGGRDPKVRMAGMLDIRGGKIYSYDNQSGHYRPNIKSMKWADKAFKSFPKHKKFNGGKNNDTKL